MDFRYAIGIDGGATKTRAALVDSQYRIMKEITRLESSNYHSKGMPHVAHMISDLLSELLAQEPAINQNDIAFACLGSTGLSTEEEYGKMSAELEKTGHPFPFFATNDAITALLGGTTQNFGILVIAGTGSIMMGINTEGTITRVGGWGALLGDEGSGYYIAVEGLRIACKQADGRLDKTILLEEIFRLLNVKDIFGVRSWAIEVGFEKDRIAAVAPAVFHAYRAKDPYAQNIILNQAKDLAWGVYTTMKHLRLEKEPVEVVAAGGNLIHNKEYYCILQEEIQNLNPRAKLVKAAKCPCIGAIKFGQYFTHK